MAQIWFPRLWTAVNSQLEYLSAGFYACGLLGFAEYVLMEAAYWQFRRQVMGHLWNQHTAIFVVWMAGTLQHRGLGRMAVVIGTLMCGRRVAVAVHGKCRELATALGERMLEVT